MTGRWWLDALLGLTAGLLVLWVAFVVVLAVCRPRQGVLREAMRILPDVIRLVHRLASDRSLPRGVRIRLGLLVAYLALPIDLIPDFVPILGYADDAILVSLTLRSVIRVAGVQVVRDRWPGSDDGFAALCSLLRLANAPAR